MLVKRVEDSEMVVISFQELIATLKIGFDFDRLKFNSAKYTDDRLLTFCFSELYLNIVRNSCAEVVRVNDKNAVPTRTNPKCSPVDNFSVLCAHLPRKLLAVNFLQMFQQFRLHRMIKDSRTV